MPKVVDHEQRRHELATALWRVVMRDGFRAVTVRSVAAESGWSSGALRHYFPGRNDLLVFAIDHAVDDARARMQKRGAVATDLDAIRAFLEELLPLDRRRRAESDVWFALASQAHDDPGLRARRREVDALIRDAVRSAVLQLAELGLLAEHRDPENETVRLHALIDGLVVHALTRRASLPAARMSAVLRVHLTDLTR
ncbi:MAG: TetR/AcrR family transcriptional regulator [Actinocatenispora sp.]